MNTVKANRENRRIYYIQKKKALHLTMKKVKEELKKREEDSE